MHWRRAVGLVQLLEGTIKALYCLCAHYAALKVVPIDYSLWIEWIVPDVCLTLDEFEGSRIVHCLSIYYIWCFKSFVLCGFPLSFVPYFFQIVFWCDGGHQSLNHFVKQLIVYVSFFPVVVRIIDLSACFSMLVTQRFPWTYNHVWWNVRSLVYFLIYLYSCWYTDPILSIHTREWI